MLATYLRSGFEEALLLATHIAFHAEEHLAQRLDVRVGRVFEHTGGRVDPLLEEKSEEMEEDEDEEYRVSPSTHRNPSPNEAYD